MKTWFLSFFVVGMNVTVGSRVSTKHGRGVITGGNIHVRLDDSIPGEHPNQRMWTLNIDKDKIEHA